MPRPTGPQFVTLYRGLAGISHPSELDPELIGPHWTHSRDAAEMFAGEEGSVVEAQIPKKHILYSGQSKKSHRDFDELKYSYPPYAVMPHEGQEEETFVRPNISVNITSMRTHPKNPIRDQWEFNPPLVRNSEKLFAYSAEEDGGDIFDFGIKGSW